jgi:hypothetical protein
MMPIANYTTTISPNKTAAEIQQMLAEAGAQQILTSYERSATAPKIVGMSFQIETAAGVMPFTLPVRAEGVLATLKRDKVPAKYLTLEHAERVAWRVLHTWVKGQLALIDAEMTTLDEVMFPWMIGAGGQTTHQRWIETQRAIES